MRLNASIVAVALALSSVTSLVACGGAEDAGSGDEQNVTQVIRGRVEIFVGEDDQFYFRVIANNNEKLLRSEGYTTRAAAEKGIESAKANGKSPKSYKVAKAQDGKWYFNLVAKNGEIIGTSETYATKDNAQRGADTLQKVFASLPEDKALRVLCSLKRLADVPGGEEQVDVDLTHVPADDFGSSDSIQAFEGMYSYDVGMDGESVSVMLYENEHVQDEVGSFGCDVPTLKRGVVFCQEPIELDASLGTDEDERMVHAFDFFCHVE